MPIIFGIRRLRKQLGTVGWNCPSCGSSPLVLLRISTWFALFFIPVIPFHFKYLVVCGHCRGVRDVPADAAKAAIAGGGVGAMPGRGQAGPGAAGDVSDGVGGPGMNEGAGLGGVSVGASGPVGAAAGWYPDPALNMQRFWDGERWTEHTAPMEA